ncbi:hypothetical protein [Bacillus sp. S3]|nr:hypothetical protein [Bacillus sp. S3]
MKKILSEMNPIGVLDALLKKSLSEMNPIESIGFIFDEISERNQSNK